jgi:predicted ester cyclase
MDSDKKDVVRRLIDGMDSGDFGVFEELCSPVYACHFAGASAPESRDQHKATAQAIYAAFPDLRHQIHDLVAEGDLVALRATPGGTHQGPFLGIEPTGTKVRFDVMALFRIVDGKIEEEWVVADLMGLQRQLEGA